MTSAAGLLAAPCVGRCPVGGQILPSAPLTCATTPCRVGRGGLCTARGPGERLSPLEKELGFLYHAAAVRGKSPLQLGIVFDSAFGTETAFLRSTRLRGGKDYARVEKVRHQGSDCPGADSREQEEEAQETRPQRSEMPPRLGHRTVRAGQQRRGRSVLHTCHSRTPSQATFHPEKVLCSEDGPLPDRPRPGQRPVRASRVRGALPERGLPAP